MKAKSNKAVEIGFEFEGDIIYLGLGSKIRIACTTAITIVENEGKLEIEN